MRNTTEPQTRARRILVVDDDDATRRTLERALRSFGHEVEHARDGVEGLAKLPLDIDLVVLDAAMPGMDGFQVCARMRADTEFIDLPIIMITGMDRREDRLRAVEVGVNDFIAKPFELAELQLRSSWLLRLKEARDDIKEHGRDLERTVATRTRALRQALEERAAAQRDTHEAHLDTIRRLVLAAEFKDRHTGAHIERIGHYCELLAAGLGLSLSRVEVVRHAATLHDVGKMGIPDAILLKQGPLTHREWETMKQHPTIGARMLSGSPAQVMQIGRLIAATHHERWDGQGYPNGLAGERIPLEGRLCAVADVFDALTSCRPYRDPLPVDEALDMMIAQRNRHFDSTILDVFLNHREQVGEIQSQYAESSLSCRAS